MAHKAFGAEIYPLTRVAAGNSADTSSIGLFGSYVSSGTKYTGVFRDHSDGVWKFFTGLTDAPTRSLISTAGAGYTDAVIQAGTARIKAASSQLVLGPAATAVTLSATGTTTRTLTLPDATDTLVGKATTDTLTNKTLTSPDINGGTADSLTSLSIRDTSAAFDVTLAAVSSSALTAGRTLTLDVKNAARSVALGGDLSLAGAFTTSGAFGVTFTATALTSVTLPTAGTLATLGGSETLTNKTLTAPDINGGTADSLTSLSIRDTSAAFDVTLAAVSSSALTAGRTLTLDVKNAARSVALGGDISLSGALTTAGAFTTSGSFGVTLTATALTSVTLPTTGTLATLGGSETFTNKTLTAPDINGGTADSLTSLSIRDTSAAFDVTLAAASSSTLTAGRTLTIDMKNAARNLALGGDISTTGAFSTVGGFNVTLTATSTTSVTLPTTGTLATLAGSETLTNKTLTLPVISSISNSGTVTIPTGTVTLATLAGAETLTNKTISGGSHTSIASLSIRDTSAAFDVTLAATSSTTLDAGRTITFDVKNAARTIALGGNLSLADNFSTSGAFATTLTATGTTNVTLPTTGTLATLAGAETLSNKTITGGSFTGVSSLAIRDTSASFDVTVTATSNPVLTAGRTLTLNMKNAARAVSLAGDISIGGDFTTAAAFATSGSFGVTLTATALTSVTLPTTGTLATLAGAETLTNKKLTGAAVISDTTLTPGGTGAIGMGLVTSSFTFTWDVDGYIRSTTAVFTSGMVGGYVHSGSTDSATAIQILGFTDSKTVYAGTDNSILTPTTGYVRYGGLHYSSYNSTNKASIPSGSYIGTSTITLAGNFATSGAFSTTLTATGSTAVTLPTTGTLATLAGSETLTNKTLTLPVISSISNGGTITIPSGADTLATLTASQTLTNKTLTLPVITSISNSGTVTIPSGTDTLVNLTSAQTLKAKTTDSNVYGSYVSPSFTMSTNGSGSLTGSNTTFTASHAGGVVFPGNAASGPLFISAFNNTTSLTISQGGGLIFPAGTAFSIMYSATSYTTGTVSQTGYIVTGSGTTFTSAMVGGTITTASPASLSKITKFISSTKLLVSNSVTAVGSTYTIRHSGTFYAPMTASQSSTTITGTGTTFTSAMVGGTITWHNGVTALITAFNSATSLTTATSQTVSDQPFTITYGVLQTDNSTNPFSASLYPLYSSYEVMRSFVDYGTSRRSYMQLVSGIYSEASAGEHKPFYGIISNWTSSTASNSLRNVSHIARFTDTGLQLYPSSAQLVLGGGDVDFQGNTTGYTTTISATAPTTNRVYTIADTGSDDTFATLAATQTLTNKTLTSPVISSISNGGTVSIPSGTDTLVTLAATQTLTNKTLTLPVISSISNGGTVSIPSGADTLATLTATQTLTNKTLTSPDINGGSADSLTSFSLRDTSAAFDVTVTATSSPVLSAGRTLTLDMNNASRTIALAGDLDIAGSFTTSGAFSTTLTATGTTTLTLPTTGTLATLAGSETFTNKILSDATCSFGDDGDTTKALKFSLGGATSARTMTITSSHTNNRTLTLPDATDTLVGRATTDTLSNKFMSLASLMSGGSSTYNPGAGAPASQSGTTVTGTGTTAFTQAMVGGWIVWASGEFSYIISYTSPTEVQATPSATIASTTYAIRYNGWATERGGVYMSMPTFCVSQGYTISVPTLNAAAVFVISTRTAVTQPTSVSTTVTTNANSGVITMAAALTLAAGATQSFTVSNNTVVSTSVVTASVANYSGTYSTNGCPTVNVQNITSGAFTLVVGNTHPTNALNGIVKISYLVS